ncbi:MAG TPA: hypothetical protein QGF58_20055 [Myxococcota bacterium]|nr:hypothetical protein [Myxococcota bacterium]
MGLMITQASLRGDALAAHLVTELDKRSPELREVLCERHLLPRPFPVTWLVDEQLMDRLYPPRLMASGEMDLPIDPLERDNVLRELLPDLRRFAAAGVFTRLGRTAGLQHHFPELPPFAGAPVVALCPARLEQIWELSIDLPEQWELADVAELVWMHELLHAAHGVASTGAAGKRSEEALVQIALAHVLASHPRGTRLYQVMTTLAERQPPHYRSFLVDELGVRAWTVRRLTEGALR